MVGWKIYKEMNEEERLEYNFKFGEELDRPNSIIWLVIFYSFITLFMGISLVILQVPDIQIESTIYDNLGYVMSVTSIILIIVVMEYLIYIIRAIIRHRNENKWLKERGYK